MAQYGRGLISLAMTPERLDALEIPLMVLQNSSRFETAFCVSIEAREGTTTGISAADRAATVLTTFSTDGNPLTLFKIPRHPLKKLTNSFPALTAIRGFEIQSGNNALLFSKLKRQGTWLMRCT